MHPATLMMQPAICYEHILRAIGQGLESLSLEAFDLEVAEDTFSIRGIPTRKESEKSPVTKLKAFKKAFLEICNNSKTPSKTPAVNVPSSSRLLRLQLRKRTLINSNETDRPYDQIGNAAHYRTACHRFYELWVGMWTTRRASYIKYQGLVTH